MNVNQTGLTHISNFIKQSPQNAVYLVEIWNNQEVSHDGCHSDEKDVQKAYYLWSRLGYVKPGRQYKLLEVKDGVMTIRDFNKNKKVEGVNEEALSLCKIMIKEQND